MKKTKKNNYKSEVTKAISEAKSNQKYVPIETITNLIPELLELNNLRKQIENDLKNNEPLKKIKNLYKYVSSINLMMISHKKLSKNEGASTEGSQLESVEGFSKEKMENLSKQIINKQFKWSTIKKLEIKRPTPKPRPLGLPKYSEKIIQNNILMILESIYEPIFDQLNVSYAFRPQKSCKDCINLIKHYNNNQGLQWIIEGDIKEAFDNVHPPTLAKILQEIIDDKDFINLIFESFITLTISKSRIIEESPMGTPQGSIISPILFNIYMNKFDKNVIKILNQESEIIKTQKSTINPEYKKISYQIEKTKKSILNYDNIKILRQLTNTEKTKIILLNQKVNNLIKKRLNIPRINPERQKFRFYYHRYEDDFIIFTNKDENTCISIKEKLLINLKEDLKLTLSPNKTLITNIKKEKAKYLGYVIFMSNRMQSKSYEDKKVISKSGGQILIGIDFKRIFERLIKENYAKKETLEPTHKASLAKLQPQEIIEHYNSVLRGVYNYYFDIITYRSQLNRIFYILYFSALKTLALKHQTTTSKIFERYGWKEINKYKRPTNRKRIIHPITILDKKKKPKIICSMLLNRNDLQDISIKKYADQVKNKANYDSDYQQFEDIWKKQKINRRTTFKMTRFCNICGSTGNLESHPIRKIGRPTFNKKNAFSKNIMRNLNKKQLIVCRNCHNKIHNGSYNSLSLKDIYDTRTIRIENELLTEKSQIEMDHFNNTLEELIKTKTEYTIFYSELRTVLNLRQN